jgi:cGMP-dependent protein kinase
LNEKQYFGERALFFQESRSATAIANGEVELFYLEKEDFLSILENNMREYLMKKLNLQDDSIELNDLEYIKPLGSGNYGEVSLVICRKNKFRYAIKGISKAKIDTEKLHRNLELEKSILLQIDHPFIVKLVKTIKNKTHIFFLMEYIQGKELFDVIREIGILNRYQTQFFGAAMMLAVEYLHEKKFIYRDIKPENIIVIESVILF